MSSSFEVVSVTIVSTGPVRLTEERYAPVMPDYIGLMTIVYIILFFAVPYDSDAFQNMDLDSREVGKWSSLYRTYTSSLLHVSAAHLAGNCLMMLSVGLSLNLLQPNLQVAAVHTLGAIYSALFAGWWYHKTLEGQWYRMVGSSGSIYAIIGAHLAQLVINWNEIPFNLFRLSVLISFAISDLILFRLAYQPHVSYAAHLFGWATGVVWGIVIFKNIRVLQWETRLRKVLAVVAVSAGIAGVFGWVYGN